MKFIRVLVVPVLLISCRTPRYHYVSPTINNTTYSQAGTGQVGIQFGSIGIGAKGGYAVSEHVNVNAYLAAFPETDNGYTNRESEFSIGYQATPHNNALTSFYGGVAFGNNEKDKIGLEGNYSRPFLQVQHAAYDRKIFSNSAYLDASFGIRFNYLIYNGRLNTADFDENVFYTQPFMGVAIGGRNVRFELLQGFSIKSSGTWARGVRIFPYFGNIGLLVKLRKDEKR